MKVQELLKTLLPQATYGEYLDIRAAYDLGEKLEENLILALQDLEGNAVEGLLFGKPWEAEDFDRVCVEMGVAGYESEVV